jgi:hypothetical protein
VKALDPYFHEVADMLANSRTVGPYVTREVILSALVAKYPTVEALRAFMDEMAATAAAMMAANPDVALLVPPKPGESEWELLTRDKSA